MPGKNIAIDLGTGCVKVFVRGRGIVLCQANAISYDAYTDEVVAVGNSAKSMMGKMPDTLETELPIKSGVIANFSAQKQILSMIIEDICKNEIFKPNLIISAPSSCTKLEKKTIIDVACAAGAGKVCVIEEPVASAIGCAADIERPYGTLVIDIGAGTCDIAVITMGQVASASSFKCAGNDMDEAIKQYVRHEKNIIIGRGVAEEIKKTVGSACCDGEEIEMTAGGKHFVSGMPVRFTITSTDVSHALSEIIDKIIDKIRAVMEELPAEMFSDICESGAILTGGSARLRSLAKTLSERLSLKVTVSADCENTAVKGAGYALKNLTEFEDSGYIYKVKENLSQI